MKLIAWRQDGTPKREQLWQEWEKIRSGREPLTPTEWAWTVGVALTVMTGIMLLRMVF